MKILILGGCGFVGYNLAVYFRNCGHTVLVADNLVRRGSEISLSKLTELGISFIHCDIRNKEDILNLPKVDIVLNCAAQPSAINYKNPEFDITNNTFGVLNILEYCRKYQIPIIQWSTNKCYSGELVNSVPREKTETRFEWVSDPDFTLPGWSIVGFNEDLSLNGGDHSIYGVSKIAADLLVQEWSNAFKIPAICNRFSCLAGPNQWGKSEQGWISWFAIANELELPITIHGFNGLQVRDCLFSQDINNLIDLQISSINNCYGEYFNIGGGIFNTISVVEAINLCEKTNKLFSKIIINNEERRADQVIYVSDNEKVYKKFGWFPKTKIEQGYDEIFRWVKENRKLLERIYQ